MIGLSTLRSFDPSRTARERCTRTARTPRAARTGLFMGLASFAVCSVAMTAVAQEPVPGRGAPKGTETPVTRDSSAFYLSSEAFQEGTRIPDRYTVEGENVSPPLKWFNVPEKTQSFAIICEDLDTPNKPWVHWVIYAIPGNARELPLGVKRDKELETPKGARQGSCSWPNDNIGYRGPATPRGAAPHRYQFTIFALKSMPDWNAGFPAATVRTRMKDEILGEATLTGTFSRARRPGETPPGVQEMPKVPGAPSAPSSPDAPPSTNPKAPSPPVPSAPAP